MPIAIQEVRTGLQNMEPKDADGWDDLVAVCLDTSPEPEEVVVALDRMGKTAEELAEAMARVTARRELHAIFIGKENRHTKLREAMRKLDDAAERFHEIASRNLEASQQSIRRLTKIRDDAKASLDECTKAHNQLRDGASAELRLARQKAGELRMKTGQRLQHVQAVVNENTARLKNYQDQMDRKDERDPSRPGRDQEVESLARCRQQAAVQERMLGDAQAEHDAASAACEQADAMLLTP